MKKKTDGSRRHGRIRFMLKRRQVLKMLGISATALSSRRRRAGRPAGLV